MGKGWWACQEDPSSWVQKGTQEEKGAVEKHVSRGIDQRRAETPGLT